jgi:5-(aminomethyl)-3-furanmethanol phosphate kinase
MSVQVIKVGGSLLESPGLALRLQRFFNRHRDCHRVVITGGGKLVEQIRWWHAERPIDEETAHWMCIDLMSITARLLWTRLPELTLADNDCHLLSRLNSPGITLFAPAQWLRSSEPRLPGTKLSATWDTTSDAIAGRLAIVLGAERLTLLKSAPPPAEANDLAALAAAGYVDGMLARLATELPPLELLNLRAASW